MAKRPAQPAAIAAPASIAKTVAPVANAVKQKQLIKVKRLLHHHLPLHNVKRQQRREQGASGERGVVGIATSMVDAWMKD
jgi:hypothetical protein